MGYNSTEFRAHLVETHGNEPPHSADIYPLKFRGMVRSKTNIPKEKESMKRTITIIKLYPKVKLNLNLRHWFPFNLCQFAFSTTKTVGKFPAPHFKGHRSLSWMEEVPNNHLGCRKSMKNPLNNGGKTTNLRIR